MSATATDAVLMLEVRLGNRPVLESGDVVFVDVDADEDASTGENGVDVYAVFEGAADVPAVLAWRAGAYEEVGDAKAAFVDGAARVELPLDLLGGEIRVHATALAGQDPETAPTDRAPDSAAWQLTLEQPALRSAKVRFTPARPRAGALFRVRDVSLDLSIVGRVDDARHVCGATLGRTRLRPVRACTWRLPRSAAGKRLAVAVVAVLGRRRFPLPTRSFIVAGRRLSTTSAPRLAIAGPTEVVFDWSRDSCEESDIPDFPARAFRDAVGRVHLHAAHFDWRQGVGPDLDHLVHDCRVLNVGMNGHRADPSLFDGQAWFAAGYTIDGRTIDVLVHNEYHGQEFERARCPSRDNGRCWLDAVTSAVSTDGGESFRLSRAPPGHLVAALPIRYQPDASGMGMYGGSNIVRVARDHFAYYAFVMQVGNGVPNGKGGACLIRTRTLADPRSWRAWDGTGFRHKFVDPYREHVPPRHFCTPFFEHETFESLVYDTKLRRWIVTASTGDPGGRSVGRYVYRTSRDLIHWSEPTLLFEAEFTSTHTCGDPDPTAYSSLLDPTSPSRTFQTMDGRGYVYYTQFNYHDCRMGYDRDLVRVPVEVR